MALSRGLFSSATDLWATPQAFFDALDAEFHFELDPYATPDNAKCAQYFTPVQDGLKQDWGGYGLFAIHHTGGSCRAGYARHTKKAENPKRLWLC